MHPGRIEAASIPKTGADRLGRVSGPASQSHERYERLFTEVEAPFAFVDLDAMWKNAASMLGRAGSKPIRVASKSIRCRALLEAILDRDPRFAGLMTFTLPETLWLAESGFENLLLAYPTADAEALEELALRSAANPDDAPVVMVDCEAHLEMIESVLGKGAPPVRVCIDVDASWWAFGGRVKAGPKRSPIHTVEQAVALAREIERRPQIELDALMAYEGQIAGLGDEPPGRRFRAAAIRYMQRRSAGELAERRAAIVAALSEFVELEIVNGGGTGSLELTAEEEAVTEVTAGSGFYAPTLFDHYSRFSLTPAAGFALPIVRKSSPSTATALGGGYLASGTGDPSRLPTPWLPEGMQLDPEEGAGEVQTPLLGEAAAGLAVGDRVYFRHAKAGELCERFDTLHLVEGEQILGEVPTYRGEGRAFL
jgi:D-serine deaminase-like pyridoxal phosphate-dependent protein